MPRDTYSKIDKHLDQELAAKRERELIGVAYQKARAAFADGDSIEPSNFSNFDRSIIAADKDYVRRMEENFNRQETLETREARQYALILEAIIHEQAELNNWLGEEVTTVKASRFDDIANGVDSIAEFKRDSGTAYLALALDVTHGNPTDKLEKIRHEIDTEKLSQVKYFVATDGSFQGSLFKVPRVVVGADRRTVAALAKLWTENKRTELAEHPMQLQLLDEIVMQLKTFIEYAEKKGKSAIVDIYRKQLRLIESIRESPEKQGLARRAGMNNYQTEDRVFVKLQRELENFR